MYSQHREEEYILRACADAKNRQVLDIGAFHPTVFSNSRALIEQGWKAVLIDPSPGPVRTLVQEYGACINVQIVAACVSAEPGLIGLNITDDAVSTSSYDQAEKWKGHAKFIGALWVPSITIPEILNRWGAFDCVSIDAEGSSVDLLRVLLSTPMFPRCVVCEYDDRLAEAQMIAQDKGYMTVYTSGENVVLVHE